MAKRDIIVLGRDSRFGAGFRVGQNADFQVLVELGPQSETEPLGSGARQARTYNSSETRPLGTGARQARNSNSKIQPLGTGVRKSRAYNSSAAISNVKQRKIQLYEPKGTRQTEP